MMMGIDNFRLPRDAVRATALITACAGVTLIRDAKCLRFRCDICQPRHALQRWPRRRAPPGAQ